MTDSPSNPPKSYPYHRPFHPDDKEALYQVCLLTGDAGKDASNMFGDVFLLGDLYVGPYLAYPSSRIRVIEDEQGVCGYVLAVSDTQAYQKWFLEHWLPEIQKGRRPPTPEKTELSMDEALLASLFEFEFDHPAWLPLYPAHLHIDMLPRLQRKGFGSRWIQEILVDLRDAGCPGVHLGMHPDNQGALSFYKNHGFEILEEVDLAWEEVLYLGKDLMDR